MTINKLKDLLDKYPPDTIILFSSVSEDNQETPCTVHLEEQQQPYKHVHLKLYPQSI